MIAIYARQSVDKKDSISIEKQIDIFKRKPLVKSARYIRIKGIVGEIPTGRLLKKCLRISKPIG